MKKIAVIGAGNWGKNLVKNFYEIGELECIVEMSPAIRERIAAEYPDVEVHDNYDILLGAGIPAVAIATPVQTHFEIARKFLDAGTDVFVEKPITMSVAETQTLVDLASQNRCVLMTGHLLLFQPAVEFLHDFIKSGKLGEIYSLHLERKNLGKARAVENVMWSLGVHDIAVITYLLESTISKVSAHGHCGLQPGIEDSVYLNLGFENGALAHLHNSWLWPEKRRVTVVVGEKGMLLYDELAQRVTLHKKTINAELQNCDDGEEVVFEGAAQPLRLELEHFIRCIESRAVPRSGPANALSVIGVLEQAQSQLA